MINIFKNLEVTSNLNELFQTVLNNIGDFKITSVELNQKETALPKNLLDIYLLREKRNDNMLGYKETIQNFTRLDENVKLSSIIGSQGGFYFCIWI